MVDGFGKEGAGKLKMVGSVDGRDVLNDNVGPDDASVVKVDVFPVVVVPNNGTEGVPDEAVDFTGPKDKPPVEADVVKLVEFKFPKDAAVVIPNDNLGAVGVGPNFNPELDTIDGTPPNVNPLLCAVGGAAKVNPMFDVVDGVPNVIPVPGAIGAAPKVNPVVATVGVELNVIPVLAVGNPPANVIPVTGLVDIAPKVGPVLAVVGTPPKLIPVLGIADAVPNVIPVLGIVVAVPNGKFVPAVEVKVEPPLKLNPAVVEEPNVGGTVFAAEGKENGKPELGAVDAAVPNNPPVGAKIHKKCFRIDM